MGDNEERKSGLEGATSTHQDARDARPGEASTTSGSVPMSKNQMKKMMKNAEWRERRMAKRYQR